jgi:hypothetical protein
VRIESLGREGTPVFGDTKSGAVYFWSEALLAHDTIDKPKDFLQLLPEKVFGVHL